MKATDDSTPRSARGLFLGYGLRPFFALAGLFSVIAMAAWLFWLAVHFANGAVTASPGPLPMHLWHAHELLFGFVPAVLAGFLLTAVPTWTATAGSAAGPARGPGSPAR